jgi:hypothetical protein
MSNHLLYVLGHLRHPRGKPFDADPVRLCQTLARKGTAEIRFETVFGRSEANVPARLGPLQIVAACRLAWRSGQISDFGTDLLRAAESPSPSGEGQLTGHPIEEVKRTPPEEFQNVEGARLDLSGEFTALRSVKLGGALDGCGLSVGPEREPSKMELESIRVVIGILKQREQELQAEYDKLMEAA